MDCVCPFLINDLTQGVTMKTPTANTVVVSALVAAVTTLSPFALATPGANHPQGDRWCFIEARNVNSGGTLNTCLIGPIMVTTPEALGNKWIATIDLGDVGVPGKEPHWRTLVVRTRVCDVQGFAVQIADSRSNNGYGGDGAHTSHDAEAHFAGSDINVYRSDAGGSAEPSESLVCQFDQPDTAQEITQEWRIANDRLTFDPNLATEQPLLTCHHAGLFDFPPYDEADAEDPQGLEEDKLYLGFNGVISSTGSVRAGAGVKKVCFYLSMEENPEAQRITDVCGF